MKHCMKVLLAGMLVVSSAWANIDLSPLNNDMLLSAYLQGTAIWLSAGGQMVLAQRTTPETFKEIQAQIDALTGEMLKRGIILSDEHFQEMRELVKRVMHAPTVAEVEEKLKEIPPAYRGNTPVQAFVEQAQKSAELMARYLGKAETAADSNTLLRELQAAWAAITADMQKH